MSFFACHSHLIIVLVFSHSGRRHSFLFVQSIVLLYKFNNIFGYHGVLEFLSEVITVVYSIHSSIMDITLCCQKSREKSVLSVNMESK